MLISTTNLNLNLTCKICGISKKQQNAVVLTDKFDNNMSNTNFCNFFDNVPQILRVKASLYYNSEVCVCVCVCLSVYARFIWKRLMVMT